MPSKLFLLINLFRSASIANQGLLFCFGLTLVFFFCCSFSPDHHLFTPFITEIPLLYFTIQLFSCEEKVKRAALKKQKNNRNINTFYLNQALLCLWFCGTTKLMKRHALTSVLRQSDLQLSPLWYGTCSHMHNYPVIIEYCYTVFGKTTRQFKMEAIPRGWGGGERGSKVICGRENI